MHPAAIAVGLIAITGLVILNAYEMESDVDRDVRRKIRFSWRTVDMVGFVVIGIVGFVAYRLYVEANGPIVPEISVPVHVVK